LPDTITDDFPERLGETQSLPIVAIIGRLVTPEPEAIRFFSPKNRLSVRVRPPEYEALMSVDVTIVRKRLKSGERFVSMILRMSETSQGLS
jgi:hypothetical protein